MYSFLFFSNCFRNYLIMRSGSIPGLVNLTIINFLLDDTQNLGLLRRFLPLYFRNHPSVFKFTELLESQNKTLLKEKKKKTRSASNMRSKNWKKKSFKTIVKRHSTSSRYKQTWNVADRFRSDRPRKTTPREDRLLTISSRRNRFLSSRKLRRLLRNATGTRVCNRTVRDRLHTVRLKACRTYVGIPMT